MRWAFSSSFCPMVEIATGIKVAGEGDGKMWFEYNWYKTALFLGQKKRDRYLYSQRILKA